MNITKTLIIFVLLSLPITALTAVNCDGNTYEINQCLKQKMQFLDKKLSQENKYNIQKFKQYRNKLCSDISSIYKGRTYESIKYGNCIISLDKWYLEQIKI